MQNNTVSHYSPVNKCWPVFEKLRSFKVQRHLKTSHYSRGFHILYLPTHAPHLILDLRPNCLSFLFHWTCLPLPLLPQYRDSGGHDKNGCVCERSEPARLQQRADFGRDAAIGWAAAGPRSGESSVSGWRASSFVPGGGFTVSLYKMYRIKTRFVWPAERTKWKSRRSDQVSPGENSAPFKSTSVMQERFRLRGLGEAIFFLALRKLRL